jgi:hypothetical protein
MTLAVGTQLGPYTLLSPIGAGGMGEVWKARDTRLDRVVALKRLNPEHSKRFVQEAKTIAALNHPHVCQLYDVGPDYLVMEYIDGSPLRGRLAVEEAQRLAIQIAAALSEAHRRGILHLTGDEQGANELLNKLSPGEAYGVPRGRALFHIVRGEFQEAKVWVEKAIEQRDPTIIPLLRGEFAVSFRSSPQWPDIARKVNVPA